MHIYSTSMQVGDGKLTLFWNDRWIDGHSIAEIAPCLNQAVGRKRRTVYEDLQDRRWVKYITGALTVQVLLDYLNIWERMRSITLDDSVQDKVLWKWTGDHCFSTASAYRAFFIWQYAIPREKLYRSPEPLPNVSSLCGLLSMVAVGRLWDERGTICRMMTPASFVGRLDC